MAAGEIRAGDAEFAAIRFVCGVRRLWRNQISPHSPDEASFHFDSGAIQL
jgi:hypothetical protein